MRLSKIGISISLFLCSTCVSRCPPRSFPNQGGVCWACHESCETCAGAGQDSCLTCAPAHLHVVDLAVCLQGCPDGYYESKFYQRLPNPISIFIIKNCLLLDTVPDIFMSHKRILCAKPNAFFGNK